jgi:sugar (pentulose or hexulose) kinase
MIAKVERVLVLVFGATTGVTLHEFIVGRGFRLLWNKEIPWKMEGSVYVWPMNWLQDILNEVRRMATPGTIIASAMWGADVVHMSDDEIIGKVFHYRSVPSTFAEQLIKDSGISKHEWSRLMGNVHPEFYQMVFMSRFWHQNTLYNKSSRVIPLADWITWKLSGQKGHDRVMLHNQGVGVPTAKLINSYLQPARLMFSPVWPEFISDQLLETENGVYVVPCTHDSALARTVLASTDLKWGLWTGSWYGVCKIVDANDKASESTFNAGLVFEAMPNNAMSAISNIGMHGPLYKALKNVNGEISYERATELAFTKLDQAHERGLYFSDQILSETPEEFAKSALEYLGGDLSLALAAMLNTIASRCMSGLFNAASALGLHTPREVAIVGGFAENAAILKALSKYNVNAVVPPFAELATQAGAAAHALCLAGVASNTKDALGMFPNVELTK